MATTLLTVAIALAGGVAFGSAHCPAAAGRFSHHLRRGAFPGASPEIMASSVATPLERQFGRIAGVTEMTSSSFLGTTVITRSSTWTAISTARPGMFKAAINAARSYLPTNLPTNPT